MGHGLGPRQTRILDYLRKEPRGFGVLQVARAYFGNEDLTFPVRDIPGISAVYRCMESLEKRGQVKRVYGLWMATPAPVNFVCAWCKEELSLSRGGLCASCIERARAACPDCGEEFQKWPRQRQYCRLCIKVRTRSNKRRWQAQYRSRVRRIYEKSEEAQREAAYLEAWEIDEEE